MLTWKRPQKHHPAKGHIFPVLLRYWTPKSVLSTRRNLRLSSIIESPRFRNVCSEIAPDREVTVFKKTTKPAQPTEPHQNFPTNLKWRESAYWAQRTVPMNAASPRHLHSSCRGQNVLLFVLYWWILPYQNHWFWPDKSAIFIWL